MIKTIIISLILFTSLNATKYVNRDATGTGTGDSWTNAYASLDQIEWAEVSAGDTIYVSGGSDSTVYRTKYTGFADGLNTVVKDAPYITYASGNPVVICKSWEANHNGDVYLMTMGSTQAYLFHTKGISNIEFNGIKFYDLRTSWSGYSGLLYIGGGDTGDIDSMQIFKNCEIVGLGQGTLIYTAGSEVVYQNCLIRQTYNELEWDQDPFGFSSGRGGYIIDNCRIEYLVNDLVGGEDAHRDVLQFSNYGLNARHEVVRIQISNNIILQPYENVNWTGIIYSSTPQTATDWYIYNNIFYSNNTSDGVTPIYLNQPDITNANRMSVHLLNNTFIINSEVDGSSTPIAIAGGDDVNTDFGVDTIICKNNLVVTRAPVNIFLNLRIMYPAGVYYRDFDYNIYAEHGGISGNFTNGEGFGNFSYRQWKSGSLDTTEAIIYDVHSDTMNATLVSFTDEGGTDIADYYSTTGRDRGVDLSAEYPFLATDILGNPRSGTWDCGALEYQGTVGTPTRVRMRQIIIQ